MSSRGARIIAEGGCYHLYGKVSAHDGEFPMETRGVRDRFIEILKFYSAAYKVEIMGFCVMGNHYHIVARFAEEIAMSREELQERVKLFYPNSWQQSELWDDFKWKAFNKRLFSVSDFMRNINQAFAKWFNRKFKRHGRLWADRFRSTLLMDSNAIRECLLYVELNPVRAGMVERPEAYVYGSAYLRDLGESADKWLADLQTIEEEATPQNARASHRAALYYRGAIPTKEGQGVISETILLDAEKREFGDQGLMTKRIKRFSRGLVIGSELVVADWLDRYLKNGFYRRRTKPLPCGGVFSLG